MRSFPFKIFIDMGKYSFINIHCCSHQLMGILFHVENMLAHDSVTSVFDHPKSMYSTQVL